MYKIFYDDEALLNVDNFVLFLKKYDYCLQYN